MRDKRTPKDVCGEARGQQKHKRGMIETETLCQTGTSYCVLSIKSAIIETKTYVSEIDEI